MFRSNRPLLWYNCFLTSGVVVQVDSPQGIERPYPVPGEASRLGRAPRNLAGGSVALIYHCEVESFEELGSWE